MQEALEQIRQLFQTHAIKLVTALGILILGWLVSLVVSGLVRLGLRKIKIDRMISGMLATDEGEPATNIEQWGSRVVFYLLMVFVLIAFFQTLGLTLITEPLNRFVLQIFEYLPRLVGPAVLLVFAWILASLLRFIVVRVMSSSKLNQEIGARVGLEADARRSMAKTIGETVYWMVFLLFFLAVLDALALQGLLAPLQAMINEVLGFLPNVFAAVLILAVGWFIARIIQRLATNVLATVGVDRLSHRLGLSSILGEQRLSGLVGLLAYIAILIPVLIAGLNALKIEAVTRPASDMLNKILSAVPAIFAAVLVLGIAYMVGRVVAQLITNLLASAGFDALLARMGISKDVRKGEHTPSEIVGYLGLVAILLFASIEALRLLHFDLLANLMSQFTLFAGHILLGLVIFAIGLYLANLVSKAILAGRTRQAATVASAAKVSILALSGAMALREMGLANEIILIAFGGVLGAVAIAMAIAFGLGGREIASDLLRELLSALKGRR